MQQLRPELINRNVGFSEKPRHIISKRQNQYIEINGKRFINFCSNDYLNLAQHAEIKQAFNDGVNCFGTGSTSAIFMSGYYSPHARLENEMADFLGRERALLFNTGYAANLSVITILASRKHTILADRLCHSSILNGILLSRAKHLRYQHNNLEHCTELFNKNKIDFLITESIFSMEGDIAPIKKLAMLAKQHQSTLIVDDAHGIGVIGANGGGICAMANLSQRDLPGLVVPLGKAFASMGAIVAGSEAFITNLMEHSAPYRYTTSLPPAVSSAALAALKIIKNEDWRQKKLQDLIIFFNTQAILRDLPLISSALTPIKSLRLACAADAIDLQNYLRQAGFFVAAITHPTVEKSATRIRISLTFAHNEQDILQLLNLVQLFLDKNKLNA